MDACPVCHGEEVRIESDGSHWFCPECLGATPDHDPPSLSEMLLAVLTSLRQWKKRAEHQRTRARRLKREVEALREELDQQTWMRTCPNVGRN